MNWNGSLTAPLNGDDAYRSPNSSVMNVCANCATNAAWPDLLRVAAINRHCVARPRGRKKWANCVFPSCTTRASRRAGTGGSTYLGIADETPAGGAGGGGETCSTREHPPGGSARKVLYCSGDAHACTETSVRLRTGGEI